ncbi:MAG: hypothetical protein EOO16_17840, partial [Chitinophagaceae bacterium]
MRRILLLLSFLILLSALLLRFYFRYSTTTVVYHVLLLAASQAVLYTVLRGLHLLAGRGKSFRYLLHGLLIADLLLLLQLYLLILGSNYFWKKTITFSVLKNYFRKMGNFIDSLPVQGWIFYAGYAAVLLAGILVYAWAAPHARTLAASWERVATSRFRKRFFIGAGTALLLCLLCYKPLLRAKRIMHFAEEPVLQLAFGNLWGQGNEVAFDSRRYALGQRDAACFDSLAVTPNKDDHTVVVILMDALRSDHLPAYGYTRATTPFLDSLQRSGQLLKVAHAFSPSTNTVGGVAGLFYSRDWESFGYTGLNLMKYLKRAGY